MKMKTLIILLSIVFTFSSVAFGGERTTIYDKNWNVKGYERPDARGTTIYDKNWNVKGYERPDARGTTIYDKNWNVKGYERDGSTYDRNWNIKSEKK